MEYYAVIQKSPHISHFGIKGMKWGIRRYQNADGSLTPAGKRRYAENYSEQQRIRDRKIYGRGAERRINKRMLSGESIQSARHDEVVRKERKEETKRVLKKVTTAVVAIGTPIAINTISNKLGIYSMSDVDRVASTAIKNGKNIVSNILRGR